MHSFVLFSMLLAACGAGAPSPAASPEPAAPPLPGHHEAADASAAYSCPMHSEVKQDGPGTCPICGMNLVPVTQGALPAHDHRTLHGGQVGMYGSHHLEYLAADGEYRVWVTNATREPITTGVKGSLKDGETTVPLSADDAQGLLVGRGAGAGTRPVVVEVTADGQSFSLAFDVVPASTSIGKGDHEHPQ